MWPNMEALIHVHIHLVILQKIDLFCNTIICDSLSENPTYLHNSSLEIFAIEKHVDHCKIILRIFLSLWLSAKQ